MKTAILMSIVVVLASGCNVLQAEGPAPREYLLEAPIDTRTPPQALPRVVRTSRPTVPPGLDGTRIRVLRADQRLDYIADARWAEPLPRLLAHVERGMLRARGVRVIGPGEDAGADAERADLQLRVERFHPVYSGAPEAPPRLEVRLALTLTDPATGRVVARSRACAETTAAANRTGAIVTGLQQLLRASLDEAIGGLARQRRAATDAGAGAEEP